MKLTLQDTTSGYVTGTLTTAAGTTDLAGFTDNGAAAPLTLQGTSLSALLSDGATVVALAGAYVIGDNVLSMSWLQSQGTDAGSAYVATNLRSLTFIRA